MRDATYCNECGGRLHLYVVGVCPRCSFDLTGEDSERDEREARERLRGAESPREGNDGRRRLAEAKAAELNAWDADAA